MGSVVRGLVALVLALPVLPVVAEFPAEPASATASANFATASASDVSNPGWITLSSGARLLSAPPTESTGSGVGSAEPPTGTTAPPLGRGPVTRSTDSILPSMETRAGLSSHPATAPPPGSPA